MRLILAALMITIGFSCSDSQSKHTQERFVKDTASSNSVGIDSLKNEIASEIDAFIESGFFNREEVLEQVEFMFYNEDLDTSWVKSAIEIKYSLRLFEQQSWEKVTDFDRLALVFDKLSSFGIIALHHAGNTKQDGESDTREIHQDLAGKGIRTRGYCFYHSQDMYRTMAGGNLLLAFGDFQQDDKLGESIGKEIVAALHERGFKTNWDGSIGNRIEVVGFKWQKRFSNADYSYERAIKLLSKSSAPGKAGR